MRHLRSELARQEQFRCSLLRQLQEQGDAGGSGGGGGLQARRLRWVGVYRGMGVAVHEC